MRAFKVFLLAAVLPVASPALGASVLSTLGSFSVTSDGYLFSPLRASATAGTIYGGTSQRGGAGGYLFSLTKPAAATTPWVRNNLANFTNDANGGYRIGQVTEDSAGNLYGTTEGGGLFDGAGCTNDPGPGCGVVFKLSKPTSGSTTWARTILYRFGGGADGATPTGGMVADAAGNLYGVTTNGGGSANCYFGCGTVFRLSPPTGAAAAWTETVLYVFQGGASGIWPNPSLLLDSKTGKIYGTTRAGGKTVTACQGSYANNSSYNTCGTVFSLTPPAVGKTAWTKTNLHVFQNTTDGSSPQSGLVMDSAGALYGTALQGGDATFNCTRVGVSGCGVVFKMKPPTGTVTTWAFTKLYTFPNTGTAQSPVGVMLNSAGNVFGTAEFTPSPGSACGAASAYYCGAVFELVKPAIASGTWSYVQLYTFANSGDGALPLEPLVADSAGTLYGVTGYGTNTVFSLTGTGF